MSSTNPAEGGTSEEAANSSNQPGSNVPEGDLVRPTGRTGSDPPVGGRVGGGGFTIMELVVLAAILVMIIVTIMGTGSEK